MFDGVMRIERQEDGKREEAFTVMDPRWCLPDNKYGIEIVPDVGLDFGLLDFTIEYDDENLITPGEKALAWGKVHDGKDVEKTLIVRCTEEPRLPNNWLWLTGIKLLPSDTESLFDVHVNGQMVEVLKEEKHVDAFTPNHSLKVDLPAEMEVKISPRLNGGLGKYDQWLLFEFERVIHHSPYDIFQHSFVIARKIQYQAVYAEDVKLLSVEAKPFVPQALRTFFNTPRNVLRPPPCHNPFAHQVELFDGLVPLFLVNHSLVEQLANLRLQESMEMSQGTDRKIPQEIEAVVATLNENTYCSKFHGLLNLEECQMQKDVVQYDLHYISVTLHRRLGGASNDAVFEVVLSVRGADENRPALHPGDIVYLRIALATESNYLNFHDEIQGRVVDVKERNVRLILPAWKSARSMPTCVSYHRFFASAQGLQGRHGCQHASECLYTVTPCHHQHGLCQECIAQFDGLASHESPFCPECDQFIATHLQRIEKIPLMPVYTNSKFHVRFGYQRIGFRMLYYFLASLQPFHLNQFLFPSSSLLREPMSSLHGGEIKLYNPLINPQQLKAIRHIVSKSSQGAPYIIFGPPGTGKTVTVIEAILQVLKSNPKARILVAAPSDAAADVLTMRLSKHLSSLEMMRLNWYYRKIASVPGSLLSFCSMEEGRDIFSLPKLEEIASLKIVVATCVLAGALKCLGVRSNHFTHVFLDEMSQAMEPEALGPLMMCSSSTLVVVAGDPKQLGATLRSPWARRNGLGMSYQERLMKLPLYATNDSRFITKLIFNYRSHDALLKLPSQLFYSDELEAHADPDQVSSLCRWEMLPKDKEFPLMFYGVLGTGEHAIDSPSYYNIVEASVVARIISDLVSSKAIHASTRDIGVITPFRQQVLHIRRLLRSKSLSGVNVGSVDDFQGQESRIIIISTVLSQQLNHCGDISASILGDPKRFNVAITRAKALVVVVGHPFALYEDKFWRQILEYSIENDAYRGCDISKITNHTQQSFSSNKTFLERVSEMSLLGRGDIDKLYPDAANYLDDPEWRVVL